MRLRLDAFLLSACAGACAKSAAWRHAQQLLGAAGSHQIRVDSALGNAAAKGLARQGRWQATLVLAGGSEANTASANCALDACAQGAAWRQALLLLQWMPLRRLSASEVTQGVSVNALRGSWPQALQVLDTGNIVAVNTALAAIRWEQAVVLFWRLRIKRTVRTLNAVLGSLASVGQWQQALPFLELRSPAPDVVSYNCLLTACARAQHWELALRLLCEMPGEVLPDQVSFAAVLDSLPGPELAAWILQQARRGVRADLVTQSAALRCFGKAERWQMSCLILANVAETGLQRDQVLCGAAADACGRVGQWRIAWQLLPNSLVTTNSVLNACAQARRWLAGLRLLHGLPEARLQPDLLSLSAAAQATRTAWQRCLSLQELGAQCRDEIFYEALLRALAPHQLVPQLRCLRQDALSSWAEKKRPGMAGMWNCALCLIAFMQATSRLGEMALWPFGVSIGHLYGTYGLGALCGVGLGGCGFGLALGQWDAQLRLRQLPDLTAAQKALPEKLRAIVGKQHVAENVIETGTMVGQGHALLVARPGTLKEAQEVQVRLVLGMQVLKACVEADVAVYPQGAKTGITGGSVPRDGGDRPSVVINMKRLEKILPIGEGQQVLCFAGAGIFSVQEALRLGLVAGRRAEGKAVSRDSHSVLGSIFLNPSVAAGVAFGSGGTQIHKGPAFTERALFLRVGRSIATTGQRWDCGACDLATQAMYVACGSLARHASVNTLGLKPQDDVLSFLETWLIFLQLFFDTGKHPTNLIPEEAKALSASDVDPACRRSGSWPKYRQQLCQLDAKVSRYNADTTGEDCCRSEGKAQRQSFLWVLILATIHDTFPLPKESKTVWISCKDFATAQLMKEKVALASAECLPKQLEYLSRAQFDCCDQGGRVLVKLIEMVGMMNLGTLWNFKLKFESLPIPFANLIADKMLWYLNPIFPESLPKQIMKQGKEFDHHLIMEMTECLL
ncbi:unnamed protein product [Effrenium voratum]|nr:unnamed protein product [Effrenium voratum]